MLGFYNYTVILTYIGLLSAFLGISFAIGGNDLAAVLCLMVSGFCDMFDGRIAATMKRTRSEKDFGIQIDSLSDLVCFGVLPAVLVSLRKPDSIGIWAIAALYLLCALIRLAFFNVDEAERQQQTEDSRKIYLGLPVTSAALLTPLVFCVGWWVPAVPLHIVAPAVMLLTAVAFLTPFRLKKPAAVGKLVISLIGIAELVLLIIKGVS